MHRCYSEPRPQGPFGETWRGHTVEECLRRPELARRTASKIQDNPVLSAAARVGYAVNGLLHILIGGIALGDRLRRWRRSRPERRTLPGCAGTGWLFVLWAVVIGMFALGLFQLLEAALVRGTDKDAWIDRAKEGGKGIAYLAVGATALQYAMGGSSSGSESSNTISAALLGSPGGVFILGLLGAGIIAIGVYFVVKGVKKKFMTDIRDPSGKFGDATVIVGSRGLRRQGHRHRCGGPPLRGRRVHHRPGGGRRAGWCPQVTRGSCRSGWSCSRSSRSGSSPSASTASCAPSTRDSESSRSIRRQSQRRLRNTV